MKRFTPAGTALAALLSLATAPAPAADTAPPASGPLPFSSFDADGDGRISQEEFNRTHTERIQQRTQSANQYRYMGNPPTFGAIDGDGDGMVNQEEFQTHQQRQRELRQQQYQQRQQQMYRERMDMGGPAGMGMGRGPGGGRR